MPIHTSLHDPIRACLFILFLALCLASPASATVLQSGQKISQTISVSGEVDEHTFSANAGDTIMLRMADKETTEFVNSAFNPRIELYDPFGVLLTSDEGNLVAFVERALVASGEFSVRVMDGTFQGDKTGKYDLHFVTAPGNVEGGVLQSDVKVSGTVDLGDLDSFRFNANAGDSIYLRVADTETTEFINSSFSPRVTVIDPDGQSLSNDSGNLVASVYASLVKSGAYTVVVRDGTFNGDKTGDFDLYYARIPDSDEGGSLGSHAEQSGRIDLGDIDTYTFSANAGESFFVRIADIETTEFINSSFSPGVRVFDPNGVSITFDSGNLVAAVYKRLVVSGEYTVVVYDATFNADKEGNYNLFFSKTPGANDGNGISGGQSKDDAITLGDIDSYAFYPDSVGTSVTLTVTDLDNGSLSPALYLMDPTGTRVSFDDDNSVAQLTYSLNTAGNYTAVVFDGNFNSDKVGNYRISAVGNIIGVTISGSFCNGLPVDVDLAMGQVPTSEDDVIQGTPAADTIRGLGGDDTICGLGGNDEIFGANGEDWIEGGPGNDFISGGADSDSIMGGPGNDRLVGNADNDFIYGDAGADVMFGGPGDDYLEGGANSDRVYGDNGNDTLMGGDAGDIMRGAGGNDIMYGEGGVDNMTGGSGNDFMDGGLANDTMFGNTGRDELYGNRQNDTLNGGPDGPDLCDGGTGTDSATGNCESTIDVP